MLSSNVPGAPLNFCTCAAPLRYPVAQGAVPSVFYRICASAAATLRHRFLRYAAGAAAYLPPLHISDEHHNGKTLKINCHKTAQTTVLFFYLPRAPCCSGDCAAPQRYNLRRTCPPLVIVYVILSKLCNCMN